MFRADDYAKVSDLAEAYELCQKRSSLVVGGMVWMKMTHITKRTIVDLSGLGLDAIEEKEGEFSIGCMCSLRQLETHEGLNRYFDGIFRECTRNIVGVQMRNCATVGGSIFARFGFSDILTCLLALDAYVELYHEGTIPLSEFAARPVRRDQKDILVRIIIKKDGRKAAYTSQRNSRTDFPVIACCVSNLGNKWFVSVGARPAKAKAVIITEDDFDTLKEMAKDVILMAKKVDGVYDDDPVKNPNAHKFESLKYIDVLNQGLKVMDSTAISLCMDNNIPLIVFDMMTPGNMKRAAMGEKIGTYVGR